MRRITVFIVLVVGIFAAAAHRSEAQELSWIRQYGTAGFDDIGDVATDASHAYVAGHVGFGQALPGQTSAGAIDAYVRKYDSAGGEVWTRQFGTSGSDVLPKLVVTGETLYLAGVTTGTFAGQSSSGGLDIFVRQYDLSGIVDWTVQFGTGGHETMLDMSADGSALYLFGTTSGVFAGQTSAGSRDFFLAKVDLAGNVLWVQQFGTAGDDPAVFHLGGVAVDDGGVTVASTVAGSLPDQSGLGDADAFLRKYGRDGSELWTAQFGTPCRDLAVGVAAHDGALYVAGSSSGDLSNLDFARCEKPPIPNRNYGSPLLTFVQKRDANGEVAWQRQYEGSEPHFFSLAIKLAADDDGVYVAGEDLGPRDTKTIDPTCPVGFPDEDIHVRAFDLQGRALWTQRVGSTTTDVPQGIASNGSGVYVGGVTRCQLGADPYQGLTDAVLIKIAR